MPKRHISTWNPVTLRHETLDLCMGGHSEPFLETWPNSGMQLAGTAYELPTWAPHMVAFESSSLRIEPTSPLAALLRSWARRSPSTTTDPVDEDALLWTPVTTPERPQKGGNPDMWPASLNQQVTEDLPDPVVTPTGSRSAPPADGPMIPTPRAQHRDLRDDRTKESGTYRHNLEEWPAEAGLLPTPLRNDPSHRSEASKAQRSANGGFTDLISAITDEGLDVALLFPTPAVNDMGEGKTLEDWDRWNAGETMRHQMHGQPLSIVAQDLDRTGSPSESLRALGGELLPTPDASMGTRGGSGDPERRKAQGHAVSIADIAERGLPESLDLRPQDASSPGRDLLPTPKASNNENQCSDEFGPNLGTAIRDDVEPELKILGDRHADEARERPAQAWGRYEPAIRRWERVIGRAAAPPTELSEKGVHRLSPRFVEWMMGLEEGHVTDVPDMTRAEQLKALGNGVVPQQACEAVLAMLVYPGGES